MSRLIEKLKTQAGSAPQPIGFRKELPALSMPTMLLVAKVAIDDAGTPVTGIEGAAGVLLHNENGKLAAKTLPRIVKPLQKTPWGVFLDESDDTEEALAEAGCDFVVLSPASPVAAVPQSEKTGKILQVESAMDDGLLRAVNDLPADAVLAADVAAENDRMLWHHLMILRHLAMLITKPLLVPASPAINDAELKALWDAGVEGLVVSVDAAKGENLKKLHDAAATLPPRSARKRKVDVFLPGTGGIKAAPPEEAEEEE